MERAEVSEILQLDVIEPAIVEWASPDLIIPKLDGSLRFCVDYRHLNKGTKRDTYPIPRMDE